MSLTNDANKIQTKIGATMLSMTLVLSSPIPMTKSAATRPHANAEHKFFEEETNSFGYNTTIGDKDIFKNTNSCYNDNSSLQEDDVMENNSMVFDEYTLPVNPVLTLVVESKKELEEMFPSVEVNCEKYMDDFEELFTSPFRKR